MKKILFIALLVACTATGAKDEPSAGLGRVARIPLGKGAAAPKAWLDDRRLLVRREKGEWIALAGIPLSAKAGTRLQVEVDHGSGTRVKRPVIVLEQKYQTSHITVPADQAELPPEQVERYNKEREHLLGVLRTFTERGPDNVSLQQPVEGPRSSSYGARRIVNGMPRSPHSGMDISAPVGAPIIAPRAGRVLDAGEYLFLGRTLILDHGQGLITLYSHLNAIHVAAGEMVAEGQKVGEIGMTGRVTGPHLHFSVYLNAVSVDPAIFLPPEK
jgi:murein DD-endopeptidase MepM/ murein hydrolase activator NlpD